MKEQRENLIRDFRLSYYSVTDLAERPSVSRKTAYKWIERWEEKRKSGRFCSRRSSRIVIAR